MPLLTVLLGFFVADVVLLTSGNPAKDQFTLNAIRA